MTLNGGGTVDGTVDIALNAAAHFAGGAFAIDVGADFTGLGFVRVAGTELQTPVFTLNADKMVKKYELAKEGVLEGDNDLTVTEEFKWTGGMQQGIGITIIAPGATLQISGDDYKLLKNGRRLRIGAEGMPATANWSGTGDIGILMSGSIENYGDFNVSNDARMGDVGFGRPPVDFADRTSFFANHGNSRRWPALVRS